MRERFQGSLELENIYREHRVFLAHLEIAISHDLILTVNSIHASASLPWDTQVQE